MNYWLRLYTSILNDPKVQRLKAEHFKGWINLLCLAKENDGTLPELPDIAFALRIGETETKELVSALQRNGLLETKDGRFTPHNWERRQYVSDVSTERVREFRKRSRNVSPAVSTSARPENGNVSETVQSRSRAEAEQKAETEQKQSRGGGAAAAAANGHALYAEEEHASRFGFLEISRYVEATKRHASNTGGLARKLYRSGEEDHQIERWLEEQARKESLRAGALIGPNDDFGPAPRMGKWGEVLNELEKLIGAEPVVTWFEPLRFDTETKTLTAPDPVFLEYIESKYQDALKRALEAVQLEVRCKSMNYAASAAAESATV